MPGFRQRPPGESERLRDAFRDGHLFETVVGKVVTAGTVFLQACGYAVDHPEIASRYGILGISDLLGQAWDKVAPALGEAFDDIRVRTVEEAWFGRSLTPPRMEVSHHAAPTEVTEPRLSFRDLIALQNAMLPTGRGGLEPNAPDQPHEADMDM